MFNSNLLQGGVESANLHFNDKRFINSVTAAMDDLQSEEFVGNVDIRVATLSSLLSDYFGLTVNVYVAPTAMINAFALPADVKANHALHNTFRRSFQSGAPKTFFNKKSKLIGEVNADTLKITGIFKEFENKIWLTSGLLKSGILNTEQLVSTLLHEMGHIWYYYFFLARQYTTNYELDAMLSLWKKSTSITAKYQLLDKAIGDNPNIVLSEEAYQSVAECKTGQALSLVYVSAEREAAKSDFGTDLYDATGWEYLADQFAARLNGHANLAKVNDKLYRNHGGTATMSSAQYVMIMALTSIIAIPMIPLVCLAAWMMGISPALDDYDKPAARITRIRNDLVAKIRTVPVDSAKVELLKEIDEIDVILKDIVDRPSWLELALSVFSPSFRKERRNQKRAEEIAALMNNEAFVHSARLSTLNK